MAISSSISNGIRRFLKESRPSILHLRNSTSAAAENATNDAPLNTPKLFISGLSRLTTNEKLRAAFAPYGQLLEAQVVADRVTGRSKGFAFIRYASIEEAEKARQGMNAKFLDGWVIFVDPAKPRQPRPQAPPESEQTQTGFRVNKTVGWCG